MPLLASVNTRDDYRTQKSFELLQYPIQSHKRATEYIQFLACIREKKHKQGAMDPRHSLQSETANHTTGCGFECKSGDVKLTVVTYSPV